MWGRVLKVVCGWLLFLLLLLEIRMNLCLISLSIIHFSRSLFSFFFSSAVFVSFALLVGFFVRLLALFCFSRSWEDLALLFFCSLANSGLNKNRPKNPNLLKTFCDSSSSFSSLAHFSANNLVSQWHLTFLAGFFVYVYTSHIPEDNPVYWQHTHWSDISAALDAQLADVTLQIVKSQCSLFFFLRSTESKADRVVPRTNAKSKQEIMQSFTSILYFSAFEIPEEKTMNKRVQLKKSFIKISNIEITTWNANSI